MQQPLDPVRELLALHGQGRFAEMEQRAQALVKAQPQHALASELLGIALVSQGRFEDALPHLEKATRREPNDPQFWDNLGLCQRELGLLPDAEASLRRALALRPNSPQTISALGSVLRALKRRREAREAFEAALALAPGHPGIRFNLAKSLLESGERAAAEGELVRALSADPRNAPALVALADLRFGQGRREEAARLADQALALAGGPRAQVTETNVKLFDSLANVFDGIGRPGLAFDLSRATYAFKPDAARALTAVFMARRVCAWDFAAQAEPRALRIADDPASEWGAPWYMLSLASATASDQLALARRLAQKVQSDYAEAEVLPMRPARPRRERLRVGYFSADYFNHPTSALIAGLIERHDRNRFEIIGYDVTAAKEDEYRTRMRAAFDRFVPLGEMSDAQAAQRVYDDDIDVLIDINGWTLGNRATVLLRKPAPIQIQWLAYAGTLGTPWTDYVIADGTLIRPEDEAHYSEKIIRLPDTYQATDDRRRAGPKGTRAEHGLPENAFVFCSFNQVFKITPDIFAIWMELLRSIEHSVLWLVKPNADAERALLDQAAAAGIARERVIFAPVISGDAHAGRLAHADLALDCFPYGSHTTASDALFAGVPLVALKGDTFASRVSSSILNAAGLPELITTSRDSYRALAIRLANDREAYRQLRGRIENDVPRSALFDSARYTRNFETALDRACARFAAGLPPQGFDISGA